MNRSLELLKALELMQGNFLECAFAYFSCSLYIFQSNDFSFKTYRLEQ